MKNFLKNLFIFFLTFALFANFVPAAKAEKFCDFSDEAQARFLKDENLLKIPKNTRIFLKLNDDLSSETVNSSDIVTVQLARDWKFKDKIVAPEGSIVSGKISFVEKAGYFNKDGKLGIDFYEIQRPDGSVSEIKVRPLILKTNQNFRSRFGVVGFSMMIIIALTVANGSLSAVISDGSVRLLASVVNLARSKGNDFSARHNIEFVVRTSETFKIEPYNI